MKSKKIRYKKIANIGILCLLMAMSCDNFTEFDRPFILVEDVVIQDIEDVERLLTGAYDNLEYREIFSRNSLASDEVRVGGGNRGQGLQEHDFAISAGDDSPDDLWFDSYNSLDNINRVIESLDIIDLNENDIDRASSVRGQALAVRALLHFDLLRAFATDFNSNTPGVIIQLRTLDFIQDNTLELPRATVGEVLTAINDDLDLAESLIPVSLSSDYEVFNLNAVTALRARIALYTEDYQAAVNFASQVIASVPPLSSTEDYFNMWRDNVGPGDDGASETIFQIERDLTDERIGNIWQDTNEDIFFSMSSDLLDVISSQDIRREVLLDLETEVTEDTASSDELIIGKYLGDEDNTRFLNHIRVFRSSEMVLIRAEANARLMNLSDAQQDIELLRNLRGSTTITPDYTTSGMQVALLDILEERRIELAFEGHRFFDLKRYNLPAILNANCLLVALGLRILFHKQSYLQTTV